MVHDAEKHKLGILTPHQEASSLSIERWHDLFRETHSGQFLKEQPKAHLQNCPESMLSHREDSVAVPMTQVARGKRERTYSVSCCWQRGLDTVQASTHKEQTSTKGTTYFKGTLERGPTPSEMLAGSCSSEEAMQTSRDMFQDLCKACQQRAGIVKNGHK